MVQHGIPFMLDILMKTDWNQDLRPTKRARLDDYATMSEAMIDTEALYSVEDAAKHPEKQAESVTASQATSNSAQGYGSRLPGLYIPGLGNLAASISDAPIITEKHKHEADAEAGAETSGKLKGDSKREDIIKIHDTPALPLEETKMEAVEVPEHQGKLDEAPQNNEPSKIESARELPSSDVPVDKTVLGHFPGAMEDDGMGGGSPPGNMHGEVTHERRAAEPPSDQSIPTATHEAALVINGALDAPDRVFLGAAMANKGNESAEWQFDSSDAESSASSDSSDTSSSDDEEIGSEVDDYELLSPEEQAHILMRDEGGGSDDGRSGKKLGPTSGPRTANEVKETIVEKPDIIVTPEMEVLELGSANNIVENFVVVKATTSGETQVLDVGSVLCLADRTVIGAVADLLGRTDTPHYSVAFTNAAEIAQLGISIDTKIYFVKDHSSYVFTQPLRLKKYTDASNINDEEVAEHEMEFSDDEAEAEYKRKKKMEKRAKNGFEPKPRPQGRARWSPASERPPPDTRYPDAGIQYDDDEEENLYTPLARPSGDSFMALPPRPPVPQTSPPQSGSWERGRGGRGRSDRGRRDRGGRGDRGRGRGDSGRGPSRGHSYIQQTYDDRAQTQASSSSPQQAYGNGMLGQNYTPSSPGSVPTIAGQFDHGRNANAQSAQFNGQAHFWSQTQANSQLAPIMPAGSFVNPNFFRNQQLGNMAFQNSNAQQQQQQQQHQQQQHFVGPQQSQHSHNLQQDPQQFRGRYQGNGYGNT